jgi:hypothetical protein
MTQKNLKHDMNLALDHLLPDSDAFEARMSALPTSSREALLWDRMQMVDALLRNDSEIAAPPDFASRVIASIAAGPAPVKAHAPMGAALALALIALFLVPLAVGGVVVVQRLLTDPGALNALVQQLVAILNFVAQAVTSTFQVIASSVIDQPILPALLITIIPLVVVWGWFMWYVSQRRQQVVYRIPVSFAQ